MIFGKSWEYWAALFGMVLYAASRDAEREALVRRLVKYASSGLLAFGLTPSAAPFLWDSEVAAAVIIMGFGAIALDMATALLRDREFIKDLLRARLGAGKDDQNG